MTLRQARYGIEEHAQLGTELYERRIRAQVEATQHGQIVAIDVLTGAFDTGPDTLTVCERLLARNPDAQIWCERVGFAVVHRFGTQWGQSS